MCALLYTNAAVYTNRVCADEYEYYIEDSVSLSVVCSGTVVRALDSS